MKQNRFRLSYRQFGWLALVIVLALLAVAPTVAARQSDPVTAAWEKARAAGAYHFAGDILRQTVPSATVANVGRSSRAEQLRLEGQTNLHDHKLELQLWSNGGSITLPDSGVAVRMENGKTFVRQGAGNWQEDNNLTDNIAPQGDFMAWLTAVKEVTVHEPETRAGIQFTRYSFQIDGPIYAAFVRDQMEAAMRQKGELPTGVNLDLPAYYRDMQGDGELWIDSHGLPLRQILNLQFPEQNAETVHLELKTDFSNFGKGVASFANSSAGFLAFMQVHLADFAPGFLLLPMLALAVILVRYQRARLIYNAVAISVILSMVIGPVLSNTQVASFLTATTAKAAAQKEQQSESDMQRTLSKLDEEPKFNPHQNPREMAEQSLEIGDQRPETVQASPISSVQAAPNLQAAATLPTDNGVDTDGDGLTDFVEARVGTNPTLADTDGDGIADGVEVRGFTLGGQQWYLDPNAADSNNDSIPDTLEYDRDRNGQVDDTDADGIPDVYDNDNDNDSVPDSKDLAPFVRGTTSFSETTPFKLIVRNLVPGKPTFVNFQLRPQNPKNLWFAYNVLDWPADNDGQVRDIDNKTYADLATAQGSTPGANDAYGDMKLVPMLELRVPASDPNIPPQSDLTPFNISSTRLADGTRVFYIPLTIITDEKTGERVAFNGQMRYLPGASWSTPHDARLVWVVQQLSDLPCDPKAANAAQQGCAADGYIHNQPEVVQSYFDSWTLTGLSVREERGTDVGIIYEDPAVDTNLKNDANLWALSQGLDQSFIGGRDADNNGQRDVNLAEVARRFDRATNGAVSQTQRWGIPNVLRVERKSYPILDQAIASTTMTETGRILNTTFRTPWTNDKTIKPLLLFAQESTYRSLGLDAVTTSGGYATFSGNQLTLDMQPAGQPVMPVNVQANMKWTAYCAPNAASPLWAACDAEAYWNELQARQGANTLLPGDPNDADLAAGRMGTAQIYNLAMSQGTTRVVESGGVVVSSRYSLQSDSAIEGYIRGALAVVQVAIVELATFKIIGREVYNTTIIKYIGIELRELKEGFSAKFQSVAKELRKAGTGGKILIGAGLGAGALAILGALGTLIYLPIAYGGDGAKISLRVVIVAVIVILTLLPAITAITDLAHSLSKSNPNIGVRNTMVFRSEVIGYSTKAGVIGVFITATIAWGFFIYGMVSNKVSAFSPQFNAALTETIATIIYAILILALSATLIGLVIVAIIAIIDTILTIICEAGVSDLRKTPGLSGACFTLGTAAIKLIAKLIYSFDVMVDTDRKDLTVTGALDVNLADPNKGFVPGNALSISLPVTTTVVHKDPAPENLFHLLPYLWFFSADNLRSTTFKYSLTSPMSQTITVNRDDMKNSWLDVRVDHKWGAVPMYRGYAVSPHGPAVANVTEPGLNKQVQTYFNIGYALPAYECWTVPFPLPPRFAIPVCYTRSLQGNSSTKLDALKFDYFPTTLDGFTELVDKGNGSLGLKWDVGFGGLADADGDGLLVSSRGGIDPNDNTWDADNDGLSDQYELERRQAGVAYSPVQCDTDNDGLTDRQEMQLGTNPAVADSDNDGLKDGDEVWHQVYNTSTCQPTNSWSGGWNITVPAQTSLTLRVSSDPLNADVDNDGVSDQAERQLALDPDPTKRVDNQNRPYNPNVFNTPPIAVFTASNDNHGFVTPGQSVLYTSTVVANIGVAPGVLEVTRPTALGTNPLLYALSFNPNATTVQTITQPTQFTVAANATSQQMNLVSTARVRLPSSSGPAWVFDPITTSPLSGFTTPARWASVAASRIDRQDSYRIAALTSDTDAQKGLGDIWSYLIPSGSSAAIEDDNNNVNFLRGNTPPAVACNNAGACMVVWDQYDNCNTLTINSLKVVQAASDPNGGIEPFLTNGSNSHMNQVWRWDTAGGTSDMKAGQQRGPNAFGFPVNIPFCGSLPVYAWESDGGGVDQPVGSQTFTQDQIYTNQDFTFSGSGHSYQINISLPQKSRYVLGGTLIKPDGTRQPLVVPNQITNLPEYNFRPSVATNGTDFAVVSELARFDPPNNYTYLALRRYDANGAAQVIRTTLVSASRAAPLTTSTLFSDVIWKGDSYRVAWRENALGSIKFNDYDANVIPFGSSVTVATDVAITPDLTELSLAYDPLTARNLLLYKQTDGWLAGRIFAPNNTQVGNVLNLSNGQPGYRPAAAWNPVTRGWMASWTNNAGQIVVAPLNADGTALVAQNAGFGNQGQTNALACPAPQSSPIADLRFEELPGATTFVDSSGFGNNATCTGTTCPLGGTAGAPNAPLSDYALQFDGVDDFLSQPRKVQDDFTIAFWIKTTQSAGRLVDAGSALPNGFALSLFDGKIFFERPSFTFSTPARYNDGQWHFVVATRSAAGSAAINVDGTEVARASLGTGSLNSQATLSIGRGGNNNGFYTGALDQLQMWPVALGADTVQALYNRTLQSYCVAAGTKAQASVDWAKLVLRQPDYRGGRITVSNGLNLTVDSDAPTAAVTSAQNNQYLKGSTGASLTYIIGGTANDGTSGVSNVDVRINGGAFQPANGTEIWTYPLQVTDGRYTVEARATDNVNRVGAVSPAITIIADGKAPQITSNALSPNAVRSKQASDGRWSINLGGTATDPNAGTGAGSGVQQVEVRLQAQNPSGFPNTWQTATLNGSNWTIQYLFANGVADPSGSYTMTMRGVDKVGNQSAEITVGTLKLDGAAPVAALNGDDATRPVITTTLTLRGLITDSLPSAGPANLELDFTSIDQVAPMADSVLYLPFDERTGEQYFFDRSGQGNNAGCAACPVQENGGRGGGGAVQTGGPSALTVSNAASLAFTETQSFSIHAWIKAYTTPTNGGLIIGRGTNEVGAYSLALDNFGRANFGFNLAANHSASIYGGPDLRDNQWHHVVAVVDRVSQGAYLYVDGVLRGSGVTSSGSALSQGPIRIGAYLGLLDEVAIFKRGLSSGEVQRLYTAPVRQWRPATLSPTATPGVNSWIYSSLGAQEGIYQIDLRASDTLGNRLVTANAWRGIVDTLSPRVTLTGRATGQSYLDTETNTRRYEISYTCRADDFQLDEASFNCAGNALRPPTRTFNNDATLKRLYPDLSVITTLINTYTAWETSSTPVGTLKACDVYAHCTTATAQAGVAAAAVSVVTAAATGDPSAVIVNPTQDSVVDSEGAVSVTIEAEAARSLKAVTLTLNDGTAATTIATLAYAQNAAKTRILQTVPLMLTKSGVYTLSVSATDWSGSVQTTPHRVRFIADAHAPTVTLANSSVTISDTYGLGSGIIRLHGLVNDEIGISAVKVRVGDLPFVDASFGNGKWDIALPVTNPEGQTLNVTVRAINLAGVTTEITQQEVVDLTETNPPDTGSGGDPIIVGNTASFTFIGTPGDHLATSFACQLDDSAFTACTSPWMVHDLSKGNHTFRVRAIDSFGFVDPSPASFNWTVNASGADATITGKPANPSTERNPSFTFTGAGAASFECALDGSGFAPCTSPRQYSSLADGNHVFQVRGKDSAGKPGAADRYTWRINNAAPVALDSVAVVGENRAVVITLKANDSDTLTYKLVKRPTHGVLLGVPPSLIYEPDSDYAGPDSFTFRARDGMSESNLATVNLTVRLGKYAVFAQEGVAFEQNSMVTLGDVGVNVKSTGPFLRNNVEASFAQNAKMQDPASRVLADSIVVDNNAVLYNPSYNDLTGKGVVNGTRTTPLALPLRPSLPTLPTITAGTQAINVAQNAALTLTPGSYGALSVGQNGTLILTGGLYQFASVSISQNAKVHFQAPSEVRIAGGLSINQAAYVGPAPGVTTIDANQIVLYVAGANGSNGGPDGNPKAVSLDQNSQLLAYLLAPNGTVLVNQNATTNGAVIGKWVLALQNTKLARLPEAAVSATEQSSQLFLPIVAVGATMLSTIDTATLAVAITESLSSGTPLPAQSNLTETLVLTAPISLTTSTTLTITPPVAAVIVPTLISPLTTTIPVTTSEALTVASPITASQPLTPTNPLTPTVSTPQMVNVENGAMSTKVYLPWVAIAPQ